MRPLVEVLDQPALHDHADGDHDWDGEQDRQRHGPVNDDVACRFTKPVIDVRNIHFQWVAQEVLLGLVDHLMAQRQDPAERHRAEGADHKQRTVGEVHNAQGAENQGQPQGNHRVCGAFGETIKGLEQDRVGPDHRNHQCEKDHKPADTNGGASQGCARSIHETTSFGERLRPF